MINKLMRNFRWQRTADRRGPRRLLVLELGFSRDKAVVLNRNGKDIEWESARTFAVADETALPTAERIHNILREKVDRELHYVSIVVNGDMSIVRLLNFPGQPPAAEKLLHQVRQTMGVDESFLVNYGLVREGPKPMMPEAGSDDSQSPAAPANGNGKEFAVLAAAVEHRKVQELRHTVDVAGLKMVSLMPLGAVSANLATVEARGGDQEQNQQALGFLSIGEDTSFLLLFNQGQLVLARQFKTGYQTILETVMNAFELDTKTAAEILNSGSFDISEKITATAGNWLHQLGISLDFVERRFDRRVEKILVASPNGGGKVLTDVLAGTIGSQFEPWNEFRALKRLESAGKLNDQRLTFANALGEGMRIIHREVANGL